MITFSPNFGSAQFGIHCEVCKSLIDVIEDDHFFTYDKVTDEKVNICTTCNDLKYHCFACSLPVQPGGLLLEDKRRYCPRDGALAIVDAAKMEIVVKDTIEQLYYSLRDYMTFPTEELSVDMIDRINIDAYFSKVGNDYRCPNLLGYYNSITNDTGGRTHSIHLLSGLTHGSTRSTLAHELTHAWIAANVPEGRNLDRLAMEGFCELIAYLVVRKLGDTLEMEKIERNAYTRGHFALFKEAKERFELRTVLDWMRYGKEPLIDGSDIAHIREVSKPRKESPKLWIRYGTPSTTKKTDVNTPKPAPEMLQLKGILGNGSRRMAMVSGKSFMAGEKGKVRLGEEMVEIRCLKIEKDFVRVEFVESGKIQELRLRED